MNSRYLVLWLGPLASLATLSPLPAQTVAPNSPSPPQKAAPAPPPPTDNDPAVQMSPFQVSPENVGYYSATTMSGTVAAKTSSRAASAASNPLDVTRSTHVYKRVGELEIRADVHRLNDREIRPVVVWIHGGALMNGSRDRIPRQMHQLVREGVVVVSIDYRLAPETKLPGIIEDLEDAFKWVRERGPELFRADPKRIGAWGSSAGGYLTLTSGFRVNPRPKVLVSLYGYGDLIGEWYSRPSHHPRHHATRLTEQEARAQVGGPPIANSVERKGDVRGFYNFCRQNGLWPREVSGWDPMREAEKYYPFMAVKNITAGYPPTFLVHGTADTDVPHEQSVLVARELQRHGVRHQFVTIENAEHSLQDGDAAKVEAAYQAAIAFTKQELGVR